MAEQVTVFGLVQKKVQLNNDVMTVVLDITSDTDEKANLAIIADFDQASFTKGGSLTPSSQQLSVVNQELSFSIPVYLPQEKPLEYRFIGRANINGYNVDYQVAVTVDPITVTVVELFAENNNLFFTLVSERQDTITPIAIEPTVSVLDYAYKTTVIAPIKVASDPANGKVTYKLGMEKVPEDDLELFVNGNLTFVFPGYTQSLVFDRKDRVSKPWNVYPEPLVDYAVKNMWGNREVDSQYHLKLARISPRLGHVNDFFYMGKLYRLPSEENFYVVYSMGGINSNFWNMFETRLNWDPFNRWTPLSTISHERGVVLDLYNSKGYIYPRSNAFAMSSFEGVTLLAIPVTLGIPQPLNQSMYLRCYSTDINTSIISQAEQVKWRFGYDYAEYTQADDLIRIKTRYNIFKAFDMGSVLFYVNGIITSIDSYIGRPGDQLEVYYDPTIKKKVFYNYLDLNDYYSELDKKRKLLLFPGTLEKPKVYHHLDDCDYYIFNRKTKQGFYYNRNSVDAVRQLTHQDMGIASQYVEFLVSQLLDLDKTKLSTEKDIDIRVLYRATKWVFDLGPNTSRINDLYLLENAQQILSAMVGPLSTVPEWSAPELERSNANKVLNSIIQGLSTKVVRDALGYNGCAQALSRSLVCMPNPTPGESGHSDEVKHERYETGLGYRIPPSYIESSTAYEYDKDGHYLRHTPIVNREWFTPGVNGYYVEFVMGQASTWLDYTISRADVPLKPGYGYRVYKAGWIIDPNVPDPTPVNLFENEYEITGDGNQLYPDPTVVPIYGSDEYRDPNMVYSGNGGKPDGNWVDITDTDQYRVEGNYIVWNMDLTNHVGMVVFDSVHLYNEFELTHMDKSIWFTITHSWDVGGLPLTIQPAQLDVWINGHPVIENVDYIIDFPRVYVISKMWLKPGDVNTIAYRARGLSGTGLIPSSELGFVQEGTLGNNGRYNLRIDRPTKTVVAGRIFMTDTVDWSEDIDHGNNLTPYNGFPYEVKHIYCANRYVDDKDLYWGFQESRELDKRVSDYLTEHVKYKPVIAGTHPYMEMDRYRLFSPFMSQLVNEMVLGFITVPTPSDTAIGYSDQVIDNLTRDYQWLLKYDPVLLGMDERFFSFQPYGNMSKPTITPNQLTVLARVNDLYLKSKIPLESFFEVIHDV